jgi:cell division septation protein DedD
LDAADSITLPSNVDPGQTIDISIDLIAPAARGTYKGNWSFEDNAGQKFGLGSSASGPIWVQVKVVLAPTNTPTPLLEITQTSEPTLESTLVIPFKAPAMETLTYDLVSEICSAQWLSNNVQQPCPGSSSEAQNAISLVTLPSLEDGSTLINPAIRISPGNPNGPMQGIYPEYLVQPGDHFRAIASCEANSISCSALLRVSYQDASNAIVDLWAVGEFYDQKYTQIDIDLGTLAGQKVKFILDATPLNTDPGNHVLWASPGVYRESLPSAPPTTVPPSTVTITPAPTATSLPSPTPTPTTTPQAEPQSWLEKIQNLFSDIFKSIFGG